MAFEGLGIQERRLLKALEKQNIREPTLIQSSSLPIILQERRDALIKAKTGSGKTLIYLLPILMKALATLDNYLRTCSPPTSRPTNANSDKFKEDTGMASLGIQSIILVPTKELANQVEKVIEQLIVYFPLKQIPISKISLNLCAFEGQPSPTGATGNQKKRLQSFERLLHTLDEHGLPLVMISTPGKLLDILKTSVGSSTHPRVFAGFDRLKDTLEFLAIDEADLLFGLGFEEEMSQLTQYLPKHCQHILLSATLDESMDALKKLYLTNAAIIKLEESQEEGPDTPGSLLKARSHIFHYYLMIPDRESTEYKYLLLFSLMKLKLLKGKILLFTENSGTAYRLKLFLEVFGIKSVVLNGELPLQSRLHMVEEANEGRYDCLIAVDFSTSSEMKSIKDKEDPSIKDVKGTAKSPNVDPAISLDGGTASMEKPSDQTIDKPISKKKRKRTEKKRGDEEYGISRGIDFKLITTVIHFDCPSNIIDYQHRTGRTGRGQKSGISITLVDKNELPTFKDIQAALDATSKTHEHPHEEEPFSVRTGLPTDEANENKGSISPKPLDDTVSFFPERTESDPGEHASLSGDKSSIFQPLLFDYSSIEGFRYRVMDTLHRITKTILLEARSKDIQKEMAFNQSLSSNTQLFLNTLNASLHPNTNSSDSISRTENSQIKRMKDVILHDKSLIKPGKFQKISKVIPSYLFLDSKIPATTSHATTDVSVPSTSSSIHTTTRMPSLPKEFQTHQDLVLKQIRKSVTSSSTKRLNSQYHNRPKKSSKVDPLKKMNFKKSKDN